MNKRYTRVTVVPEVTASSTWQEPDIKTSLSYFNYSTRAVHVVTQFGLETRIDPLNSAPSSPNLKGKLLVRMEVSLNGHQAHQILNTYNDRHVAMPGFMVRLIQLLQNSYDNGHRQSHYIDYLIDMEQDATRDTRVIQDLGIMVKTGRVFDTPHPDSTEGRERLSENMELDDGLTPEKLAFFKTIELVDNEELIRDRYINALGVIYRIKPTIDRSRASGAYVTTTEPEGRHDTDPQLISRFYSYKEVTEENGFYSTYEDALEGTDPKLLTTRIERDNLRHKKELTDKTNESAIIKEELNQKNMYFKELIEERKRKEEEDRHRRESMGNKLKVVLEVVKNIATAITAIATIFRFLSPKPT